MLQKPMPFIEQKSWLSNKRFSQTQAELGSKKKRYTWVRTPGEFSKEPHPIPPARGRDSQAWIGVRSQPYVRINTYPPIHTRYRAY